MVRRLIAGQVVPWRRHWASPTARLSAGHDGRGFLDDPEDELGRALNPHVHQLRDLLTRPCLVLSGQPGIGKTIEVDELAAKATEWLQPNERLIKLTGRLLHSPEELRRRTIESAAWTSTITDGGDVRLLLDGVDEALRRLSVLVLDLVDSLKEQPLARVKVILVCRAAEWHHADGQALASLWREDAASVLFELCPLRWKDVELAAQLSNVDPEWFWREVTRHRVQGLAARPITLRLLLDEARAGGEFPSSHHELFSRAIQRLCGELDDERARHLPTPSPPATQIMRVAARIASLTMLGGRDIIARHTEDVANGDLPIDEIAGGYETVGGEKFSVTRELVASALDTPLFSLRGPERYGFDHQTFAEHLAADYLSGCAPTQLRRLLCVSFDGRERVAPQLAEVAARLATMNSSWCEHLISTEPELLLRADASPLTDEQREHAIAGVLLKAARQEAFDEAGTGFFYHTLRHPRLAEQLRPYIEDPTHNAVVRRMALSIAGDAKVSELEPLLWERIGARDPAFAAVCGALWDITGLHSRDRLTAALHGDLPDNDRGNLRDLAITKLVPAALNVRDVLPFLRPPSAERISFAHGISKHLTLDDVPPVLAAMESGRFIGHDFIGLNELGARAFEMAMENLEDPKVGPALAHYWRVCARNYHSLPYRSSRDPNPLRGLDDPAKRRRLIRLLLELPASEAHDIDRGEMTLVRLEDAAWMLEQLPEIAQQHRAVWAQVCARQVWHALPSCSDALIQARHAEFPELRAALPAAGRFDIATTVRRLRRAQELHIERVRARNSRRWPTYSRAELMVPIWRELETNDTVWVGFCDRAFKREDSDPAPDHHRDHGDITTSPGWVDADEGQRNGLRTAARRFLIERHDSARPKQEWNNWARAACFAIALLRDEIDSDHDLRAAIERNWPRVAFDNPEDQNSAVQRVAVAAVYQLVPDVAVDRLSLRLRAHNCRDGYLLDLERYLDCWDSRLVNVVRQFLFTRGLRPRALRRVFAFLAEHDRESAISLFDDALTRRGGFAPLNSRGRALLSIALFLLVPERWERGWAALKKRNAPIARRVFFEAASEYLDRDFRFHEPLTTAQLTSLCARVWQLFPAVEYNEWHDAHGHVGARHMMPGLRDGLTGALVTRATLEACASLRALADLVPPDQRVWMQWRHNEAVKNALRLAWTARTRTPAQIIAIARDFRVVAIDTIDELLEAVEASLERLQCRLHMAESAELHALWNEPGRTGVATPKDELVLSNIVHDWIKRDLGPNGGIVLNREVQATLLSKLDIKVEALSSRHNAEPLTLIIEIKGDWHPQITTALGKQLAKHYLLPNHWTHGIYLVGWFQSVEVQGKKRGWPPPTFTDAEQIVRGWAQTQTPSGLIIRSHLLDCRLAQSSQRVKTNPNSLRSRKRLSSTKPHAVAA
ncbi:MAG TPA: hypothetical protein VJU77_01060 [Chthoniobacterales bacterium]|nr:hypothetical protein [Chthoniobacterales bacterium]